MTEIRQTASELDASIDRLLTDPTRDTLPDDGELTATARLLRDALPRLHPRFGFEEHLAARLAAARDAAATPGSAGEPIAIAPRLVAAAPLAISSASETASSSLEHRRRSLVAGGAIASGVSLAGAALVVWRRSRSGGFF